MFGNFYSGLYTWLVYVFHFFLNVNRFPLILFVHFSVCLSLDFNYNNERSSEFYALLRFHPNSLISFISGHNAYNSLRNVHSFPHGFVRGSKVSAYSWLINQFQFPFGIRPTYSESLTENSQPKNFRLSPSLFSPDVANPNISSKCLSGLRGFVDELQNSTLWALKSVQIYWLWSHWKTRVMNL